MTTPTDDDAKTSEPQPAPRAPEELQRVLHELRLQQVELEAQNEELQRAQAELELIKGRYFDLYNLAPVGYCTSNERGELLQSNLTLAALLGVVRGELDGQPITRLIHADDQHVYDRHQRGLVATGEPQACELRLAKADGGTLWAHLASTVVTEGDGQVVHRTAVTDITERRRLQQTSEQERTLLEFLATKRPLDEALAGLLQSYEALFHGMRGAVLLLMPDGTLRQASAPSLPATFCADLAAAAAQNDFAPCGEAAFTGQPVITPDIGRDPRWRTLAAPARESGLHACWSIPITGTEGAILGAFAFYFGTARDATASELATLARGAHLASLVIERHRTDAKLRESEALSRTILDSVSAEIAVLDREGAIIAVNAPWRRFSVQQGSEPGEPARNTGVGTNYLGVCRSGAESTPVDIDAVTAHDGIRAVLDGTLPTFNLEYPCATPREQLWFNMSATPLGSTHGGVVVAHTDVTDRKRAELENAKLEGELAQAVKMQSVGRLAGGVAHDFNNMLCVILGHVDFAMDQVPVSHPIHVDLVEVRKAAQRSADLTRQLLAFARKQTVAPKVLDLDVVIEGMLSMLRRMIGEDVHIVHEPQPGLWAVKIDPSQIDQILTNLCVNARDAIASVGTITLETANCVSGEDDDATPGEYVRLTVRDDGAGMSKEVLAHVFEPFFTTKGAGQGTGLGLATVYGVLEQNHGFVRVSSTPGRGTTFELHLPRYTGKSDAPSASVRSHAAPPRRSQETILLVEDDPSLLAVASRLLEAQGYRVLKAGSPSAALQLAREHSLEIHLLMTDVVMPEMNGRDLARTLVALYPHFRCLFMSGYTANVGGPRGGLDDMHFIQKPFSKADLTAKVRAALNTRPS
jgi:PAS domain S-box-containing protein